MKEYKIKKHTSKAWMWIVEKDDKSKLYSKRKLNVSQWPHFKHNDVNIKWKLISFWTLWNREICISSHKYASYLAANLKLTKPFLNSLCSKE